jgi:DNA-binding transcriptional ArsR family regulator
MSRSDARSTSSTPEEILRVLADPERLAVAGVLGRGPRAAGDLSRELELPPARIRHHLSRLMAVGVARVQADRRTYVLDPDTLRQAAREVGPPREPGMALGAVFEGEEAILRQYFRGGGCGRSRQSIRSDWSCSSAWRSTSSPVSDTPNGT